MIALIVGISSALFIVVLLIILKQYDKPLIYGLTLTGIGFLYIGYTWTDLTSLIITSIQAIVFLTLSYFGVKKTPYFLAIGYILHGCWDIAYNFFDTPGLIPPQYDIFCSSLDFTIGIYLLIYIRKSKPAF